MLLGGVKVGEKLERELKRITASGLITMTVIGRQKHYQANRNSPIFQELRGITLKTFGLSDVLRLALSKFADAIRFAFIYCSLAVTKSSLPIRPRRAHAHRHADVRGGVHQPGEGEHGFALT